MRTARGSLFTAVTVLQRFVCALDEGRLMRPSLSAVLPVPDSPGERMALEGLLVTVGRKLDLNNELSTLEAKVGLVAAVEILARRRLRREWSSTRLHRRSLCEVANDRGYTRHTLRRHAIRETGMSPREMRQRERIAKGLELIDGGMKIQAAAHECGYRSERAFFVAVKKLAGVTPAAVRRLSHEDRVALRRKLAPWRRSPRSPAV